MCKPGRAHIPNATYQVPQPMAFWLQRRRDLKSFYHIWVWWPCQSCDHNNLYKSWLTNHKELSYEIWFQLAKWFLRKLCFNMLMGLGYERPWLKGQRSTLTFDTRLNLSSDNNDFGFHSSQKINFSKNSHSNALGSKLDLDVK